MEGITVFLFLLLVTAANSVDFESCRGDDEVHVTPNSLYLYKCLSQPCTFIRGDNVTGAVNFTVGNDSKEIEGEVQATINGAVTFMILEGVHKCSGFAMGECSYEAGNIVNYYFVLPVYMESLDDEIISFKILLRNEEGTLLSCNQFTARILNPPEIKIPATTEQHDGE